MAEQWIGPCAEEIGLSFSDEDHGLTDELQDAIAAIIQRHYEASRLSLGALLNAGICHHCGGRGYVLDPLSDQDKKCPCCIGKGRIVP